MVHDFIAAGLIVALALVLAWALDDRRAARGEADGMAAVLDNARSTIERAEAIKEQVRQANAAAREARVIAADHRAESRNWTRIAGTAQLEVRQARSELAAVVAATESAEAEAARWRRIAADALALVPGEQVWNADDTVQLHEIGRART